MTLGTALFNNSLICCDFYGLKMKNKFLELSGWDEKKLGQIMCKC